MHDCILHATWNTTKKKSTKEELVEIFNKLPEDLKEDAYEWGFSTINISKILVCFALQWFIQKALMQHHQIML